MRGPRAAGRGIAGRFAKSGACTHASHSSEEVSASVRQLVRAAADGTIVMATALKPYGPVVVIGDPEGLSENPTDCLLSAHASMSTCTTRWPASTLLPYNSVAARARQLGVGFIPTRGFFCFQRACPAVIGQTVAYWDNSHITPAYALEIADAFRTAFLPAAAKASHKSG